MSDNQSGWQPHLTVADLRADPEDETSAIESHDLHFTIGDISLLVNVQGGAGFAWALDSRDGRTNEHGSKNTDEEGAYRSPSASSWQQRIAEAAFREGYDFGQADRRFDVTDADDAWHKSGTRQNAKDALPPSSSNEDAFVDGWEARARFAEAGIERPTITAVEAYQAYKDALPPVPPSDTKPRAVLAEIPPFLVVRKCDADPAEVTPFHRETEAREFFARVQAQWTEAYLCRVIQRGMAEPVALPPAPDASPSRRLSNLLQEIGDVKIQFGLRQQGHLPTVERMRSEGATWDEIGKVIGWHGPTVEEFYAIEADASPAKETR